MFQALQLRLTTAPSRFLLDLPLYSVISSASVYKHIRHTLVFFIMIPRQTIFALGSGKSAIVSWSCVHNTKEFSGQSATPESESHQQTYLITESPMSFGALAACVRQWVLVVIPMRRQSFDPSTGISWANT